MSCPEVRNQVSAYLDNEISLPEQKNFEHHIEHCSECSAYFQEIKDQELKLSLLAALPLPEKGPEQSVLRWRAQIQGINKQRQSFNLNWRYFVSPITAAIILIFIYFLTPSTNLQYYRLTKQQVKNLEIASTDNVLKYRLGVILTELNNSPESDSLNLIKARIMSDNLIERINEVKLKAFQNQDFNSARLYTQLEMILLGIVNDEQFSPASMATITL